MTTLLSLKNLLRVASSMALLALICTPVHGQWTKLPASAIPTGPRWKTDSRRAGSSIVRRPPGPVGNLGIQWRIQPEPCERPQTCGCPVSALGQGTRG